MTDSKKFKDIESLSEATKKTNRNRNIILILVVSLEILILFSVFSMVKGRYVSDSLKSIQEKGNTASAYLENANEEQYETIKKLGYVDCVGKEYLIGVWKEKSEILAICKNVDHTSYSKMIQPAYTNVTGHYPTKRNEIMMPSKLLEKMNITNPELGMQINIPILFDSWSINDGNSLEEQFVLSGCYDDHIADVDYMPTVYLSTQYLEKMGIPEYPAKLNMVFKDNFYDNLQIEKRLYQDVELTEVNQQFVGTNSSGLQFINQMFGGLIIAIAAMGTILLSSYLFIYNIFSISLYKDIRYYGLLFITGTTVKQIKKLVFIENKYILLRGILLGAGMSWLAEMFLIVPLFDTSFFSLDILAGSIFTVVIMELLASKYAIKKLQDLNPMEIYRYQDSPQKRHRNWMSLKGTSISQLARYNVFCSKRKFVVTVFTLFLSCETALLAIFISSGTDIVNQLTQKPDFKIGTTREAVEAYLWPYRNVEQLQISREESLFDKEFIEELCRIEGVEEESINLIKGCYGSYDFSDEYVQPLEDSTYGTGESNTSMTIQVISEQYMKELENYAKRNQFDIDIEAVKSGNGILVLHEHELSEESELEAAELTGRPAKVYTMDGMGDPEDEGVDFSCAGYLDTTLKDFPELEMSWTGKQNHYFLVGEKGFQRLNYPEQIFGFTMDAKKGMEKMVKDKLTESLRVKNNEQKDIRLYYLSSTSDEIAKTETYVKGTRMVMWALNLSLSLMGIINYINVINTNVVSRKKELAIMRNIGMTKKQMKTMIIKEGLIYWKALLLLLLSIGMIIFWGAGEIIKMNVTYFKFVYPIKALFVILIILLIFCISLPQVIYKKYWNEKGRNNKVVV